MREPRPCSPPSLAGCSCQEPIVFDLATTVLAAPLVVPMDIDIDPNSDGLPGIAQLRTIVGAVMTVGLILSVLALIISRDRVGLRRQLLQPAPRGQGQDRRPRLLRRRGDLRGVGHAHQLLLERRPAGLTAPLDPGVKE